MKNNIYPIHDKISQVFENDLFHDTSSRFFCQHLNHELILRSGFVGDIYVFLPLLRRGAHHHQRIFAILLLRIIFGVLLFVFLHVVFIPLFIVMLFTLSSLWRCWCKDCALQERLCSSRISLEFPSASRENSLTLKLMSHTCSCDSSYRRWQYLSHILPDCYRLWHCFKGLLMLHGQHANGQRFFYLLLGLDTSDGQRAFSHGSRVLHGTSNIPQQPSDEWVLLCHIHSHISFQRRRLELYDNEKNSLLYQHLLCDDGGGNIAGLMRELH